MNGAWQTGRADPRVDPDPIKVIKNQEVSNVLRVLKVNRISVVLLGLATLLGATLALGAVEDQIRERIQPAGEVCVMGTECAASLAAAAAAAAGPRDGATVYANACTACHATGANNAPIRGNAEQWAPRLAKGKDVLMASLVNGFNNGLMPAKGLCMDCTDEELQATLDYMLEGLQ